MPPPAGRRMVGSSAPAPKTAGRLSSAKKWVKGMFREKGGGKGEGQGEVEVEGDVGEEEEGEETDVDTVAGTVGGPVAGPQMTSRGRWEGYF